MKEQSFIRWYVQHSKKLSIWGLLQWCFVAASILLIAILGDLDDYKTNVLISLIQWSATLSGVVVSGYMLNSAAEKVFKQKINSAITAELDDKQDDEAGCG